MEHILSIVLAIISSFGSFLLSIISYFIFALIIMTIVDKIFKIGSGTIKYGIINSYIYSFSIGITMGAIQGYLIATYNLISYYFYVISLLLLYNWKYYTKESTRIHIFNKYCQLDIAKFKRYIFINRCFTISSFIIAIFSMQYYLK